LYDLNKIQHKSRINDQFTIKFKKFIKKGSVNKEKMISFLEHIPVFINQKVNLIKDLYEFEGYYEFQLLF